MYLKMLCAVVLSVMMITTNAQFRNIPADVTEAFHEKYPDATRIKWRDKILSFQAEFEQDKTQVKATFTSDGDWIKTEKKISYDKLPAEVKEGFKKSRYADDTVREVVELDDNEKGLQYIVVVKKGDITKRALYFTATGQFVKDELSL